MYVCMYVCMYVGDNRRTARTIAESLGVSPDYVMAETLPSNKVQCTYLPTYLPSWVVVAHSKALN